MEGGDEKLASRGVRHGAVGAETAADHGRLGTWFAPIRIALQW